MTRWGGCGLTWRRLAVALAIVVAVPWLSIGFL